MCSDRCLSPLPSKEGWANSQCQGSGLFSLLSISPSFTSKTAKEFLFYLFPKALPKPKFILRWVFMPWREYSCRCLLRVQKWEVVWQFSGSLLFFVVKWSEYWDSWCTVGNLWPTKLRCKKAYYVVLAVFLILTVAEAQQQVPLERQPSISDDRAALSGPVIVLYHTSNVAGGTWKGLFGILGQIKLQGNYGHFQLDRYEQCSIIH